MITQNKSCRNCGAAEICKYKDAFEKEFDKIMGAVDAYTNKSYLSIEQAYGDESSLVKIDISCKHHRPNTTRGSHA
jgi:hypothetical protein